MTVVQHAALFFERDARADEPGTFYDISQTTNVFIIVYDAFQNDTFQEIVADDPSLSKSLEGFTLFRDTLGAAGSTTLTMADSRPTRPDPGPTATGDSVRKIFCNMDPTSSTTSQNAGLW